MRKLAIFLLLLSNFNIKPLTLINGTDKVIILNLSESSLVIKDQYKQHLGEKDIADITEEDLNRISKLRDAEQKKAEEKGAVLTDSNEKRPHTFRKKLSKLDILDQDPNKQTIELRPGGSYPYEIQATLSSPKMHINNLANSIPIELFSSFGTYTIRNVGYTCKKEDKGYVLKDFLLVLEKPASCDCVIL